MGDHNRVHQPEGRPSQRIRRPAAHRSGIHCGLAEQSGAVAQGDRRGAAAGGHRARADQPGRRGPERKRGRRCPGGADQLESLHGIGRRREPGRTKRGGLPLPPGNPDFDVRRGAPALEPPPSRGHVRLTGALLHEWRTVHRACRDHQSLANCARIQLASGLKCS